MFVLPAPVIDRLEPEARIVEVGVGGRFDTLADLARRRPDAALVATDVHAEALEDAPAGVEVHVDDVTRPTIGIYEGAALLYAVRCPAELQVPLARVAEQVGSTLAIRAFKDEWADVDRCLGPHTLFSTRQGAWRAWTADGGSRGEGVTAERS